MGGLFPGGRPVPAPVTTVQVAGGVGEEFGATVTIETAASRVRVTLLGSTLFNGNPAYRYAGDSDVVAVTGTVVPVLEPYSASSVAFWLGTPVEGVLALSVTSGGALDEGGLCLVEAIDGNSSPALAVLAAAS